MHIQKYSWVHPALFKERLDVDYYEPDIINMLNKIVSQPYGSVTLSELVTKKQSEPQTVSSMFKETKDNKYTYPVLTMKNLKNFYIDYTNVSYINDEDFNKLKDFELKPGTVIYGLTGSLGQASVIPVNVPKSITNRRIAQIFINESKADPYYIATFLNNEYGIKQFYRLSTGGVQPNLRLEDSVDVIVPLPPLKIQKYIGNKVRKAEQLREKAIDLKEEAEKTLSKATSEKSILKPFEENHSLFNLVDTDMIQTKRLDADFYKEVYVDLDEYIYRNKDRFTQLKNVAKLSKNKANLTNCGEKFIYLDISSLNEDNGLFEKNEIITKEAPSRAQKLVTINDILVSTVRPNRKGIGIVTSEFDQQVASTGFAILQAKENPYFLLLLLRNDIVTKQLIRLTSGGLYPAISEEELMEIYVPIVDKEIMNQIEEKIKLYYSNLEKSQKLITQAEEDMNCLIKGNSIDSRIDSE